MDIPDLMINIATLHDKSLKQIEILSKNFAFEVDSKILNKKEIKYADIKGKSKFDENVKKYFSDHLPIYKDTGENIIITWNIGIGNNNQSKPFELIKEFLSDDQLEEIKHLLLDNIANMVMIYVNNMILLKKPVILHLQECSLDIHTKINRKACIRTESVEPAVGTGVPVSLKFHSDFMPQVIATVKESKEGLRAKIYYNPDPEDTHHHLNLGLSSFVFSHMHNIINVKLYPTSAKLFKEPKKKDGLDQNELHLESRINLVLIRMDDVLYVHYNLHFKKHQDRWQKGDENKRIQERLELYSKDIFLDIKDQTKTEDMDSYKQVLFKKVDEIQKVNNLISLTLDRKQLTITDNKTFIVCNNRYMCGDFNVQLDFLEIPNNMNYNKDTDKVDYIIEITRISHEAIKINPPHKNIGATRDKLLGTLPTASFYSKTRHHTLESKKHETGIHSADWRVSRTPDTPKISKFDSYEPRDEKPSGDRWEPSGDRRRPSGDRWRPSGDTWRKKYLKYKEKYLKLKLELDL